MRREAIGYDGRSWLNRCEQIPAVLHLKTALHTLKATDQKQQTLSGSFKYFASPKSHNYHQEDHHGTPNHHARPRRHQLRRPRSPHYANCPYSIPPAQSRHHQDHAEMHMRRGEWAEAMPIIGIECVGLIASSADPVLPVGTPVAALMGGLGRTINGSYAEYTSAPISNVVKLAETEADMRLGWAEAATIPETFATAWTTLFRNLEVKEGQRLLVRGGTSSFGRAAIGLASAAGVEVTATTRKVERGDREGALPERRAP